TRSAWPKQPRTTQHHKKQHKKTVEQKAQAAKKAPEKRWQKSPSQNLRQKTTSQPAA
ncbi:hypothetical protein CV765_22960, partial [Salmonella enterica subsp. enterica serovar Typhi]